MCSWPRRNALATSPARSCRSSGVTDHQEDPMKKALLIVAFALIPAMPALAQTAAQPKDQETQNCQAKPDANGQQQKQKQEADTDELSKQLGDCGGVLEPPPTGDKN